MPTKSEAELNFKDFLNKIDPEIEIDDFITIERNIKYSLRYELGDELNNGTKKRVNQAVNRACKIFKECFVNDSEIYLLSYDWSLSDNSRSNFLSRTPGYLYEVLKTKRFIYRRKLVTTFHAKDEEAEYKKGRLGIFDLKTKDLDIDNLFRGIANTDMGFDPCIHQIVYIFGKSTQKVFWMYDDRGCLIMSQKKSSLEPEHKKFNNWLCEGYDKLFEEI